MKKIVDKCEKCGLPIYYGQLYRLTDTGRIHATEECKKEKEEK